MNTVLGAKSEVNDSLNAKDLFISLFLLFAGYLVFVFLPVSALYRFSSFYLSMTAMDFAVNVGAMSLLLMIIALFASLSMMLVALPLRMIMGPRAYRGVYLASLLIVLIFTGLYGFDLLRDWVFTSFKYWLSIEWDVVGFVVFTVLLFFTRRTLFRRVSNLAAASRVPLVMCAIASLCLVSWRVIRVETQARTEEPAMFPAIAAKKQPNIILLTFDALSAEDMSLYGYRLPTTPNIDAFARECFVFKNAISTANWTKPAIGSLLTGKYPINHRLINKGYYFTNINTKPEESLPALLAKNGYRSVALVANWVYAHPYITGLTPFFEEYPLVYVDFQNIPLRQSLSMRCVTIGLPLAHRFRIEAFNWLAQILIEDEVKSRKYSLQKNFRITLIDHVNPFYPPELVFKDAEKYLSDERVRSAIGPLFIWLHVFPPHEPYLPASPFKGTFLKSNEFIDSDSQRAYTGRMYKPEEQPTVDKLRLRYDETILHVDSCFGDFIKFLRSTKRLSDSIIIISADHGESFTSGYAGHGTRLLHNSLIRIPLLMRLPAQQAGKSISALVSQTDIAVTILDILGKPVPAWADGVSLKPYLTGKDITPRPIFTMNLEGNNTTESITKGSIAVLEGDYKYVRFLKSGAKALYHERTDPGNLTDLAEALPDKADHLNTLLVDALRRGELPR